MNSLRWSTRMACGYGEPGLRILRRNLAPGLRWAGHRRLDQCGVDQRAGLQNLAAGSQLAVQCGEQRRGEATLCQRSAETTRRGLVRHGLIQAEATEAGQLHSNPSRAAVASAPARSFIGSPAWPRTHLHSTSCRFCASSSSFQRSTFATGSRRAALRQALRRWRAWAKKRTGRWTGS